MSQNPSSELSSSPSLPDDVGPLRRFDEPERKPCMLGCPAPALTQRRWEMAGVVLAACSDCQKAFWHSGEGMRAKGIQAEATPDAERRLLVALRDFVTMRSVVSGRVPA